MFRRMRVGADSSVIDPAAKAMAPRGRRQENAARREESALPTHCQPRGSPAHAAPRAIVQHDIAAANRLGLAQDAAQMPVLLARKRKATLLTQ
jgi:hypothetical protein